MISNFLLRWHHKNRRDLPLRLEKPNPYKTWISEMMLQQTQVDTVLPYFERFLKKFPTVADLAKAKNHTVLKLWSGLGYYSRARNVHRAAQIITKKGTFPSAMAEWHELPGVGPYSAGAIASIAFGEKVPVVDGNVIRVLTRVHALAGDPKARPLKEKLWNLAAGLVPARRPGDFNQALMELGALVCTSKNPKCGVCPLQKQCKAHRLNKVAAYPTPKDKVPVQKVEMAASLIQKNGSFLLAKRSDKKHLQSMWEFPQILPEALQIEAKREKTFPIVRHAIMNRRIQLTPRLYQYISGRPKPNRHYVEFCWITPKELQHFPTSSINHKILQNISFT